MAQRIVIMAGGTGGHVFPALAVAQYLQQQNWEVSWLGSMQGIESRVIPEQGIAIDWLSVSGLRGKGMFAKISAPFMLLKACIQAFNILRQRKPNVVLGMGGFVAGPGGLMAKLLGIPLVIHEQNRVPGTTNKLLSKIAAGVLQAFDGSFKQNVNAQATGNPLRKELLDLPQKELWQGQRDFRILILGGSQGAQILNTEIPNALAKLTGITIKHQTGSAMVDQVNVNYKTLGLEADVSAFIKDMRGSYLWADMLICRAGAMTVSEVAAAGLPAIFIPFPHAIDDHQTANARILTDIGAAFLLAQNDLTSEALLAQVVLIQKNIATMSQKAKQAARPDATQTVANICITKAL
jgi:UDP-N-acetylglucosamine--N-acetylmuramyl-(pentapeptide) pyrophosphoryl-undecaprenol N-acetylglucosamine transferase